MKWLLFFLLFLYACSGNPDRRIQTDSVSVPQKVADNRYKIISDSTNPLTGKEKALELNYIAFRCACANWITLANYEHYKYSDLIRHCIFIGPADSTLELPFYFDPQRYSIKVAGQFYERKDYPKGTIHTEETLEKEKVFRYTKLDLIDHPNRYFSQKTETLTLDYNAIECECAQWSESRFSIKPQEREYLYLERANNHLINADTLWDGSNLPLQVRVTGQLVSLSGYPKGYKPTKGDPEPAMIFRYTTIKVLNK